MQDWNKKLEEVSGDDAEEESYEEQLKTKRNILRKKLTATCNQISKFVENGGSRTLLRDYMAEAEENLKKCDKVNEELCDQYVTGVELEEQREEQEEYRKKVAACIEAAQDVLECKVNGEMVVPNSWGSKVASFKSISPTTKSPATESSPTESSLTSSSTIESSVIASSTTNSSSTSSSKITSSVTVSSTVKSFLTNSPTIILPATLSSPTKSPSTRSPIISVSTKSLTKQIEGQLTFHRFTEKTKSLPCSERLASSKRSWSPAESPSHNLSESQRDPPIFKCKSSSVLNSGINLMKWFDWKLDDSDDLSAAIAPTETLPCFKRVKVAKRRPSNVSLKNSVSLFSTAVRSRSDQNCGKSD